MRVGPSSRALQRRLYSSKHNGTCLHATLAALQPRENSRGSQNNCFTPTHGRVWLIQWLLYLKTKMFQSWLFIRLNLSSKKGEHSTNRRKICRGILSSSRCVHQHSAESPENLWSTPLLCHLLQSLQLCVASRCGLVCSWTHCRCNQHEQEVIDMNKTSTVPSSLHSTSSHSASPSSQSNETQTNQSRWPYGLDPISSSCWPSLVLHLNNDQLHHC